MKWRIDYSKEATRFIEEQKIHNDVREEIKKFLIRMQGGEVNLDLKKLIGDWKGYYRIRRGKIRIIF